MKRQFQSAAIVAAAASLGACAINPPTRLDVAPGQVWKLVDLAPAAADPKVVEGRPAEDRQHHEEPLSIHIGDDHIEPAPTAAVASALAARLGKPVQRAHLAALTASAPMVLKRLDITIAGKNLHAGSNATPFGSFMQVLGGGSNVDVVVAIGVGDRVFLGLAHGNLTASPSAFSISRLFGEAMDKVADAMTGAPVEPEAATRR